MKAQNQNINQGVFSDKIQALLKKNDLNIETLLVLTVEDLQVFGFPDEVIKEIQITLFKNGKMLSGDENYYAEWSGNLN